MLKSRNAMKVCAIGLLAMVLTLGCNKWVNPTAPTASDEADVQGFIISDDNGHEIVTVEGEKCRGEIDLARGQNNEVYSVAFYDGEMTEVTPNLDGCCLNLCNGNSACIEIEKNNNHQKWEFSIHGKRKGETSIELLLVQRDETKYRSPAVPVMVK